jgi:hypothetical protein
MLAFLKALFFKVPTPVPEPIPVTTTLQESPSQNQRLRRSSEYVDLDIAAAEPVNPSPETTCLDRSASLLLKMRISEESQGTCDDKSE